MEKNNETKTNVCCPTLENERSGGSRLEHPEMGRVSSQKYMGNGHYQSEDQRKRGETRVQGNT